MKKDRLGIRLARPVPALELGAYGFEGIELVGARRAPSWRDSAKWYAYYRYSHRATGDPEAFSVNGRIFEPEDEATLKAVRDELRDTEGEYRRALKLYQTRTEAALSRLKEVPRYDLEPIEAWVQAKNAEMGEG